MAEAQGLERAAPGKEVTVVPYDHGFRDDVVRLWDANFNNPDRKSYYRDIDASLRTNPGLFWIAVRGGELAGTCVGASDGHRCWIYYLCVTRPMRRRGIASALLDHVEGLFRDKGVRHVGLQVLNAREAAQDFYRSRGYLVEETRCFGKRLS